MREELAALAADSANGVRLAGARPPNAWRSGWHFRSGHAAKLFQGHPNVLVEAWRADNPWFRRRSAACPKSSTRAVRSWSRRAMPRRWPVRSPPCSTAPGTKPRSRDASRAAGRMSPRYTLAACAQALAARRDSPKTLSRVADAVCGIAGFIGSAVRADEARRCSSDDSRAAHRGPDGNGYPRDARRRPRARAPVASSISPSGDAADAQRGRHRLDHVQRRDLQLRRAARRARCARPPLPHAAPTPRSSSTSTRSTATDFVEQLNGQFAIALWDRDAPAPGAGARPRRHPAAVLRASTTARSVRLRGQGAAARCPGVRAELDPLASTRCFTFWSPLAPRTVFAGVAELPPGHMLVIERRRRCRCARYWDWTFPTHAEHASRPAQSKTRSPRSCARCWSTRCACSCAPTCRSAPISAAGSTPRSSPRWSGGFTDTPLRTFSVAFEDAEFDESALPARDGPRISAPSTRAVLCARRHRRGVPAT